MPTLQEHAGFGVAQADDTGIFECLSPLHVHFPHEALLGLPELILHLPEVLLLAVVLVLLPEDDKEDGTGGKAENQSQDFPEPDTGFLLVEQGVEIHGTQVVGHALLWGLQLDGGVIQDQLAHPGQCRAQLQHLLCLLDALGALPADVVANDIREGLDRGVEFLIHRLQAELGCIQRLHYPHGDAGSTFLCRNQVKGSCIGSLVDDLLIVVPVEGDEAK